MKLNSNKLLIGIAFGILLLVIAAFIIVLNRPEPEYLSENSPDDVAHNYLLAIQEGNYERAFRYLSPDLEYPAGFEAFVDGIENSPWEFQINEDVALVIESTAMTTNQRATVTVRQTTFTNAGLFSGDPNSQTFALRLENQNGQWKLIDGDMYWSYCWGDEDLCNEVPVRER
jgi:hypothetical protein